MNNGRKRITYRPNKLASAITAVVGVIFVLIGIFLIIPTFGLFGVFWTMIAAVLAVFSIFSALGTKVGGQEMYSHEVIIEDMEPGGDSLETRLGRLQELYDKRVITKDEYDARRREILKEL